MAMAEARGIRRLMGSAWFAVVLAFLAVTITSFCLATGFGTDDYFFIASFKGFPGLPEYRQDPMKTFVFSDGDLERNAALMDRGVSPWWSVNEGKLAFWRPIASRLHWLDYALFGENPHPMHIENMLWYAVLCVLLFVFYRRLFTPLWVAGLAALLYTIDSDNGMNVGWISSRNTLMSACFVVAVLLAHHRWRAEKSTAAGLLAPVLLCIGLLCGEAAMGALAYLFAYALFMDNTKSAARFAALIPCGTVFAAWFIAYRAMGYGTVGSAWYVDPGHAPLAFLKRLLQHFPALVTNQFIGEPNTVARVLGGASAVTQILGLVALALIFLALLPLLRRSSLARFAGAGALLSMLPVCTVVPQPRLMLIPGIGGMILISMYLEGVFSKVKWLTQNRRMRKVYWAFAGVLLCALAGLWLMLRQRFSIMDTAILTSVGGLGIGAAFVLLFLFRFESADWVADRKWARWPMVMLGGVWVILHGIIPAYMMTLTPRWVGSFTQKLDVAFADLPASESDADNTITILQAPNDFTSWYFHIMRSAREETIPKHTRILSTGDRALTISRPDAQTLVLRSEKGLIRSRVTSIYRGAGYPMRKGDVVNLSGMTATVREVTADGWPIEAEFRFALPLEDDSLRWYCAVRVPVRPYSVTTIVRFVQVGLPAVGETTSVEALAERSAEYQVLKTAFPERAD